MLNAISQTYSSPEKYIINHDIMSYSTDGVEGSNLYSGRALAISQPSDIIQINPDLRPLWADIVGHYQRVGIEHSSNVVWHLASGELAAHAGYKPSVFFYGPGEFKQWGDYRWLEAVQYINSKNNFITLAQRLGMDVPDTWCFDRVTDISSTTVARLRYPCYLKGAVSIAGAEIYYCENPWAVLAACRNFADDEPVQIQEEIKSKTFLTLLYRVNGHEIKRLAVTEQILNGFVSQGSSMPACYEPWEAVDIMAHWLKVHGIKGMFAFDVAVVETSEGPRFPAIECNPRFYSASYPMLVAAKLHIAEWQAITLSTRYRTLSKIDIRDIEYNPETGRGMIIINWGTVLVGSLHVLIAGPKAYRDMTLRLLVDRL